MGILKDHFKTFKNAWKIKWQLIEPNVTFDKIINWWNWILKIYLRSGLYGSLYDNKLNLLSFLSLFVSFYPSFYYDINIFFNYTMFFQVSMILKFVCFFFNFLTIGNENPQEYHCKAIDYFPNETYR